MKTIDVKKKTLKLNNVVMCSIPIDNLCIIDTIPEKLSSYILSKGHKPVGPIIQYSRINIDGTDESALIITFLQQASGFINSVEAPYEMKSTLRVTNCLYTRFTGLGEKINIAYSKLIVYAYENEIELKGDSYTVFLEELDTGEIIVDVFMECLNV